MAQPIDEAERRVEIKKILNVAHEIGENGHPLNDDLLADQIESLIAQAVTAALKRLDGALPEKADDDWQKAEEKRLKSQFTQLVGMPETRQRTMTDDQARTGAAAGAIRRNEAIDAAHQAIANELQKWSKE